MSTSRLLQVALVSFAAIAGSALAGA